MAELDNTSKLQIYEYYIANNITEWEAESVARVCRKIGKIGRMSKKELEKFDADKEAKKEWERIEAALAIDMALNIRTLKKAYTSEFEAWEKQNGYLYQYRGKKPLGVKNGALQGIIEKAVKQNGKDILNLTNTKALSVLDRNGNPIRFQDAIYKSFSDAVKTVTEGKADFYTTMRQTVLDLGGSGARVEYPNGMTRRLDTVVRQNMLYNAKMSSREYNKQIGKELGCDGIEVSFSVNPRPTHRFMEGRQFCNGKSKEINGIHFDGAEDTRDAESGQNVLESLDDYNCNHRETPIICGVSEPAYSPEELARLKAENERQFEINGISKDGYGWSQVLRNLESNTRNAKDQINALKAFGNSETQIADLNKKIKAYRQKYNEICDITGIKPDYRRLGVAK